MKPLQAKIFSYCTTNINPPSELQLNEWLAENPEVEIVHAIEATYHELAGPGTDIKRVDPPRA